MLFLRRLLRGLWLLALTLALVATSIVGWRITAPYIMGPWVMIRGPRHLHDEIGLTSLPLRLKIEASFAGVLQESDVDMRFVFARDLRGLSLEQFAAAKADELQAGRNGARGLLFVYHEGSGKFRIEVGYGLEPYFPDSYVAFWSEHAREFFAAGDPHIGLKQMGQMFLHRIRDARMGDAFNPDVIEFMRNAEHLSGGGGVSTDAPIGARLADGPRKRSVPMTVWRQFGAQPTVAGAFERYLLWMASGTTDTELDLFTPQSQAYLALFPLTKAFQRALLISEYDRQFTIVERDDLAILYFTNTPFVSPHLFRKGPRGWQLDIYAEVNNTREYVASSHTWGWVGRADSEYTRTFSDLFERLHGAIRVRDGDNRQLPPRAPRA
jgi:hypothetical protein